jgi:6-phosphogluconolactonase
VSDHSHISVVKDAGELSRFAAATICELIGRSVAARGISAVALAGGETPRRVYELLAADPFRSAINWRLVHLFFGDERVVPPDDPASNFGMVSQALFNCIPIPSSNIHRIRGEALALDAGREYEDELQKWFDGRLPRFDIVMLGVGEDGHTASLFPGTESLRETSRAAIGYYVPQLKSWRVTLTLPVLLNAREILFMASGKRKASVVARTVEAREPRADLPASMVRPTGGNVHWVLDEEAASLLSPDTVVSTP